MLVSYVKADPSGNTTVLVESPVAEPLRPALTRALLELMPEAEQLGYVSPCGQADIRLDMSGGEFCGNASLSAAALHFLRSGKSEGRVSVSVSGSPEPVTVELRQLDEGLYSGSVDMPRPLSVGKHSFPGPEGPMELPVVVYPGISHVIITRGLSEQQAEELIAPWCRLLEAEALGLMLFEPEGMKLRPLVWVPGSGTLFWEHSCASGSSAVGTWLAQSSREPAKLSLHQPGGCIGISAHPDGSVRMSGCVRLFDAKTLEII